MIGLVIFTHGQLAAECLHAAEMIIGPVSVCRALSMDRTHSVEDTTEVLAGALRDVGADGDGVLVLTDMFGGTPTNIAAGFLAEDQIDILTGVNLPMLIKAVSARSQMDLTALAEFLCDYGQQAIRRPAQLLKPQN